VSVERLFEWRYWRAFTEWEIWQFLLTGLQVTLSMAAVAIALSLVLGTVLALMRSSRFPLLHWPAVGYIEIIRALPVLYLIFFAFFGGARYGLSDPVWAATVALTVYTSAVNAEIIRAGILSVERGQVEAARSLGLTYFQTMRYVVLPQALRRVVPPQVSQFVTLIKDTSLAYIVGTNEFMRAMTILYSGFEVGTLQGLFVASLVYFAINYAVSQVGRLLELREPQQVAQEVAIEAGRSAR
jgi:His/Glu/Gln/Arg/opine family amino acid ABC transporter permease subunit